MSDPFVRAMALTRMLSALTELVAATLIFRSGSAEAALRINAVLGLIGPVVLALTASIGLMGMASYAPSWRLVLVGTGAALILLGTR